ncbi:fungal specific transcription factor domain-containing protein [Colletotrichum scovillei]|uniref:Fungal specific transcription factor domain-containing protein n=1 Tax=Colletotrichum scovillei TaxID=1209932 RepID=A0A9P7UKA2_9PEZI|nr:fungal specific transcription factor domain-containing protein [Colletotrichum scovillei]KAG7076247.1 fungal specific transcription factor domain-containing protein [Colletotrichum scovillei]KAG7083359.1 fungal specific transcription factor domain-containing protein [Colletotrichum scovillei]
MNPDQATPPAGPSTGGSSNPSSTSNSSAPGPGPSSAYHSASASAAAAAKRSRVLLSCGPCRASKLKCDRSEPCGQCLKKSRPEGCVYAPKPEKQKPAKGMAARLKRLEGMVRTMMDEGGGVAGAGPGGPQTTGAAADAVEEEKGVAQPGGQLVQGGRASTYVGATHFMAILEDIEDMKSYFEEPETDYDESPEPSDEIEAPDLMLFSRNMPRSREDLLKLLPEQKIVDRLIMRYFSSRSPSQPRLSRSSPHGFACIDKAADIVHRPTFEKQYAHFWTDPSGTDLHWLALLFMVMSLGVFYSTFMAPHELSVDSPQPPMDRFKLFRAAAACCLVWGRYTHPTIATIPPFILYVEAEFIISRAAQMNCYVLSSVCLRLLLKMGLHRDPDRLLAAGTAISPYEGEMRRRMWNMAVQLDLLVSFHMGLPSMLNGIDADCSLPRNLVDEDFDEDTLSLPPARPATDYTEMTYPINKSAMMLVFGQVARQSHLLAPPPYAEVMRLDDLLNASWRAVPQFMMVKPLQECVTTPPMQIIQRFGLASLYNKSRCVLHRRFLLDPAPRREHDYSRRQCLEGAVVLLDFQNTIWHACQPGNMLSQNGWFVSSLAVHDFLLAATIIYLAIGHEPFWGGADNGKTGATATTTTTSPVWMAETNPPPTRAYLLHLLQRSYSVWIAIAGGVPEVRKTAGILETMLNKLGSPPNSPPENGGAKVSSASGLRQSDGSESAARSAQDDQQLLDGLSINDSTSFPTITTSRFQPFEFVTSGLGPSEPGLDRGWAAVGNEEMDWRYFDNIMAQPHNDPVGLESLDASQPWFERTLGPDDFDFSTSGAWDPSLG